MVCVQVYGVCGVCAVWVVCVQVYGVCGVWSVWCMVLVILTVL